MFAGSCIGVVSLVMVLELLRRAQREYDAFIRRQDEALRGSPVSSSDQSGYYSPTTFLDHDASSKPAARYRQGQLKGSGRHPVLSTLTLLKRQVIRATIHMLQFGVAYFIMLLAMYYNGSSISFPF